MNISIKDISGKVIESKNYFDCKLIELDLKKQSGLYLIIIESEGKKAVIRMAKE